MTTQSSFRDPERASQRLSFHGLKWGKVSFTDIDAIMELKNKAWIVVEAKQGRSRVPFGQRLALDRMHVDLGATGKHVLSIVARHNTPVDQEVDLGAAKVTEYKVDSEWLRPEEPISVRELVDAYIKLWGIKL